MIHVCHAQGIQVMNDSGMYSGFTSSFLTVFQDEYRKTPALVFPFLSGLDADASTSDVSTQCSDLVGS